MLLSLECKTNGGAALCVGTRRGSACSWDWLGALRANSRRATKSHLPSNTTFYTSRKKTPNTTKKPRRSGDNNSLKRKTSHLLGWKNYTSPESIPNPLASGSLCCRATWQFPTSSRMASSSPQSLGQAGPPNRYPAQPAGPQIPQHPSSGGEGQGHLMDRFLHPSFKLFGVIY